MITADSRSEALQAFYVEAERQWLHPHWLREGGGNEPRADVRPWLWGWERLRACMLTAAQCRASRRYSARRRSMMNANGCAAPASLADAMRYESVIPSPVRWRVVDAALSLALALCFAQPAVAQTGPLPTDVPTGATGRVGFDGAPGYRLGGTMAISDCSSIQASYTWYNADTGGAPPVQS